MPQVTEAKGQGSAKGTYEKLATFRDRFLKRAEDASRLTIPSLLPEEGHTSNEELPTPWQGVGARGVNNLASKLLLSLLPTSAPFFRLIVDPVKLQELEGVPDIQAEIQDSLVELERRIQSEIELEGTRVRAFEAIKHLLVAGNTLLHFPDKGPLRVFHLDQYVIDRDPEGNVLEIITKEMISPDVLPEEIRAQLQAQPEGKDKSVELYSWIKRTPDGYKGIQEAAGHFLDGTEFEVPLDQLPYIPLRFTHISNESYGRGHVEEYLGDLQSLEGLSKAIVEGSAAAARTVFLVRPGSTTRLRDIARARNGAVIHGNRDDVGSLQLEKFNDFRVTLETMNQIRDRLGFAFLLNTSVQRDAERVTAEEIRFVAQELEDTLGGVYSLLTQEFQLPLVERVIRRMQKEKRFPKLPEGLVRPKVITGIEALGRANDMQRLQVAVNVSQSAVGPEELARNVNPRELIGRIFAGSGVETEGLLFSEEEIQQRQQNAQIQQLVEQLGPNAINQIGALVQQQQATGGAPPPQ